VSLLLADFVTFNQIHGMSGLSGIAPAVLRSLECAPSGRDWSLAIGDLAACSTSSANFVRPWRRRVARALLQPKEIPAVSGTVRLGGHPIRYPLGRPENPRAIIPFVNRTLTGGLPIASTPQKVNEFNS
jgi:hypothetical protein